MSFLNTNLGWFVSDTTTIRRSNAPRSTRPRNLVARKVALEEYVWIFSHTLSPMSWSVDLPMVPRLFHLSWWLSIVNPSHLPSLSKPYNSVFQTLIVPTTYFSRFFCLFSLASLRSRGVLWIVGPSSTLGKCFSWKGGPFPFQDPIFLVFL